MQINEAKNRELARVREQKNEAIASLEKIAVELDVAIPPGYTTRQPGIEILKNEFLESVKKMLRGKKLLPVAVVNDERYADLSIFWCEEVAGSLNLHYQEGNRKGFVSNFAEIENAVNKRSGAKFVKSQIISSFCDDVAELIIKSQK